MLRFNLYGVYRDFADFVQSNKIKIAVLAAIVLTGCALGVRAGMKIAADDDVGCIARYNIYLLICGKRGFFGYFISRLLSMLVIILAMSLLSYGFYTVWINVGIVFLYVYFCFRAGTAAVVLLKITFLPAAVLCVFPFAVVFSSVLCLVCAFTLCKCAENGRYGGSYVSRLSSVLRSLCLPCVIIALLSLAETLLAFILTLGVSV